MKTYEGTWKHEYIELLKLYKKLFTYTFVYGGWKPKSGTLPATVQEASDYLEERKEYLYE